MNIGEHIEEEGKLPRKATSQRDIVNIKKHAKIEMKTKRNDTENIYWVKLLRLFESWDSATLLSVHYRELLELFFCFVFGKVKNWFGLIDKQTESCVTHSPDYGQHYAQLTDQWSHYNKILPWHKLSLHQRKLHRADHLVVAAAALAVAVVVGVDLVVYYNMTPLDYHIPGFTEEEGRERENMRICKKSEWKMIVITIKTLISI